MLRVLAVTAALSFAAACGTPTEAKPAKTASPSPSAEVDAKAREACDQLTLARVLRVGSKSEKPAGGYGTSTSEMKALSAEMRAQSLALKSTVPEVRKAAMGSDPVPALRSWCKSHHQ